MRVLIGRASWFAAIGILAGSTLSAAAPAAAASAPAVRWLHVYPGIGATTGVAPAPNGGAYAVSSVAGKVILRHLASNGGPVSKVTAGNGDAGSVGSDAAGVYVAWADNDLAASNGLTIFLRKYDNAGHSVWTKHWGIAGEAYEIHGVAASNGKVYVMYAYQGGSGPRIHVLTASNGAAGPDWLVVNENDGAGAMAVNGNAVYTAINVSNSPSQGTTVRLDRWTLSGAPVWHRLMTVGANELTIAGLALDPTGVTTAFWYFNTQGYEPMVTQRDTLTGNKVWSHTIVTTGTSQSAADGTGVYVSWQKYAGTVRLFEVYVRKYSFAGAALWTARVGVANQLDYAYSLAAGPKSVFIGAATGGYTKSPMVAAIKKTAP